MISSETLSGAINVSDRFQERHIATLQNSRRDAPTRECLSTCGRRKKRQISFAFPAALAESCRHSELVLERDFHFCNFTSPHFARHGRDGTPRSIVLRLRLIVCTCTLECKRQCRSFFLSGWLWAGSEIQLIAIDHTRSLQGSDLTHLQGKALPVLVETSR